MPNDLLKIKTLAAAKETLRRVADTLGDVILPVLKLATKHPLPVGILTATGLVVGSPALPASQSGQAVVMNVQSGEGTTDSDLLLARLTQGQMEQRSPENFNERMMCKI